MVSTQPKTTSSTASGSIFVRSTRALSTCAPRSAGCALERPPLRLPTGVRTASMMNASAMVVLLQNAVGDLRAVPRGVAPRGGEGPRALHPQMQVVLVGIADGAVALQRRARADEIGRAHV